jgi:hypothetical protein
MLYKILNLEKCKEGKNTLHNYKIEPFKPIGTGRE